MKKPRAPKLVTVAVTTTITIIFWIFFTLYQVLTSKPNPSVDPALLEPIDPNLNTEVLGTVKDRIFFDESVAGFPDSLIENTPQITPLPTETPTETPAPTETQALESPTPEPEQ